TKEKGSATRASTSRARWGSGHDLGAAREEGATAEAPAPHPREARGYGRTASAFRVPLKPRRVRAVDRRRAWAHAGIGPLDRARAEGAQGDGAGQAHRRAAGRP